MGSLCCHHHWSWVHSTADSLALPGCTYEGAVLSHGIAQLRMKRGVVMLYLHEKVGRTQYRTGCWDKTPCKAKEKDLKRCISGMVSGRRSPTFFFFFNRDLSFRGESFHIVILQECLCYAIALRCRFQD